jgi:thiosulfate dehydrogenase
MRFQLLTLLPLLASAVLADAPPARPVGVPGNIIEVPVALPGEVFVPPALVEIPEDKHGDMVKLGRNIFVDTPRYASRFAGNGLACASCHLAEGRKPDAFPLWAAFGMYPNAGPDGKTISIEARMQDCFRINLSGQGPPLDSPEMQALSAYAQWLSTGAPARTELPGRRVPRIELTGKPDSARGAQVYQQQCTLCHGTDGAGVPRTDGVGHQFPPLWGNDSYTAGSALNKPEIGAAWIRANMPPGRGNSLSVEDAVAVAAWLADQPRPANPRHGWLTRKGAAP